MNRRIKLSSLIAVLVGMSLGMPNLATAEELENTATSLAKAPAVRHRLLLVKGRFEVAPAFESTINADFKHTLGGGLKVEYHLSDMFSFGAVGIFGTSINTGLANRIYDTLPLNAEDDDPDPTPTQREFEQHLNSMPIHGAGYATITPWYGKLAAFGKAFVNFDFYFSGGLAFAQLTNNCADDVCKDPFPKGGEQGGEVILPDNDPNNDIPGNDGTKVGLYLGGGIHVFVNQWIAIDFTVRDYIFADNPSGLDFDADLAVVAEDDNRVLNHLFMGLGVSLFFPMKAQRTN